MNILTILVLVYVVLNIIAAIVNLIIAWIMSEYEWVGYR